MLIISVMSIIIAESPIKLTATNTMASNVVSQKADKIARLTKKVSTNDESSSDKQM